MAEKLKQKRLSAKEAKQVVNLYQNGFTHSEIGALFGISASSISRRVRNAGVDTRPCGPRRKISTAMVLEFHAAYRNGYSVKNIAEMHGVCAESVYRALRAGDAQTKSAKLLKMKI